MDLTGRFLVVWLPEEAMMTVFGAPVAQQRDDTLLTSWMVGGEVAGESPSGLWLRIEQVVLPDERVLRLGDSPIYFIRWDLVTTARLFEKPPRDLPRAGLRAEAA
jgi:hypothetical protein